MSLAVAEIPSAVRSLYPFFPKSLLRTSTTKLSYLDEGSGPPVLMVHGNPTWSFYYRNLVRELSETHRCLVPDHLGMGLSEMPPATYKYRLRDRIDDLDWMLELVMPTGEFDLVVHDWGGMIGLGIAVRHAARIRRIVVLNTACNLNPKGTRVPLSLALARTPILGSLLVRGMNAFVLGLLRWGTVKPLADSVREGYLFPYLNWERRQAVLRFVEDIPLSKNHPTFADVEAIADSLSILQNKKMLVAWGKQDFVFDDSFLAEWKKTFPKAEYVEYPEAGHLVLEDAGDDLIPRIARFLRAD